MATTMRIRAASLEDAPAMASIEASGFGDSAYHKALFPESLRSTSENNDPETWYLTRMRRGLERSSAGYIVCVADDDPSTVLGFAEWVAPQPQHEQVQEPEKLSDEEKKRRREEALSWLPSIMDREAVAATDAEIGELMKEAKPAFGGRNLQNMWTLNSIAVHPDHRRKGVGSFLTRWGIEQAEASKEDIWLISAPNGRRLYKSLGFKEIAIGSRAGEGQYVFLKLCKDNNQETST